MSRRGFTLVEVIVAIVLTGVVLSVAAGFVGAVGPLAESAGEAGLDAARLGNTHATVRELVAAMDLGIEGGGTFSGRTDEARFWAWYRDPRAGARPLAVVLRASGSIVTVEAEQMRLHLAFDDAVALAYHAGGQWRTEWVSGTTLPAAIRLASSSDTVTYWTGARG